MENIKSETSLSISCVTFNSDMTLLESTIESLVASCQTSVTNHILDFVDLYLIDNGSSEENLNNLVVLQNKYGQYFRRIKIFTGHGNIGYGRGNNLAISESNCSYHLIANPDILARPESIDIGIRYLEQNSKAGVVAPSATEKDNQPHYIAKRHPTVIVLLARAIKLKFFNRLLEQKLRAYEYRDKIPAREPFEIELASGCFMLCKTSVLQSIGGFDPRFFMYFEDFDLSIRLRKISKIVHLPSMHVVHMGGDASRKGWLHIYFFSTSFFKFLLKN